MKFEYVNQLDRTLTIKQFLYELALPRGFVTSVKFQGQILLDGQPVTVRAMIHPYQTLTLIAPDENGHDTVVPSFINIDVIYEDEHLLIVNKPADVVSIPSIQNPDSAMANRIKGYYIQQGYADQVIHIVTRLDRDTTGLMLIAKHRLSHALCDRAIQERKIYKEYYALTMKKQWDKHGWIDAPIARHSESLITRCVDSTGKPALTEYWLEESLKEGALLKLRLHTGRTHQIRVHCAYMSGPLIGDDLYGGPLTKELSRQALHCGRLLFEHPFTKKQIEVVQPLPEDMTKWLQLQRSRE